MKQAKKQMLIAWLNAMLEDSDIGPVIKPSRHKTTSCDNCTDDLPTVLAILFGKVGTRRLCMKCSRKHAETLK